MEAHVHKLEFCDHIFVLEEIIKLRDIYNCGFSFQSFQFQEKSLPSLSLLLFSLQYIDFVSNKKIKLVTYECVPMLFAYEFCAIFKHLFLQNT